MTPESIKTFLRQYVASLSEETQRTKNGDRFGFDYLIENLGSAENWILHRSPSHPPGTNTDLPQPKKESEHGVDFAFITRDQRELIVFALKDEKLTYKNFEAHSFRSDLSRASAPDLDAPELANVKTVRIILAYNKSEDEEGIEEYNRLVKKLGTKVGDHVSLRFERWNLERLVDEFHQKLFTPALLPPNFFRKFTYICLQVEDFSHGSAQWEEVLIPDWREFLEMILADPTPRSVWMLAVALPIVQQHGKMEPTFATGWIDLLEWAMLALWDAALRSKSKLVANAVYEIWMMTYVMHLEQFYLKHGASLSTEDSLTVQTDIAFEPAAESYLGFWHLARLGLLWHSVAVVPVKEARQNVSPSKKDFMRSQSGSLASSALMPARFDRSSIRTILSCFSFGRFFMDWAGTRTPSSGSRRCRSGSCCGAGNGAHCGSSPPKTPGIQFSRPSWRASR